MERFLDVSIQPTSQPTSSPTGRPSGRPSRGLSSDTNALPVSFTLFLYAGLAGLLLSFVICFVRVLLRYFCRCNFKLYGSEADSSIEIIREADAVICDEVIHQATIATDLCHGTKGDSMTVKAAGDKEDSELPCAVTRSISLRSANSFSPRRDAQGAPATTDCHSVVICNPHDGDNYSGGSISTGIPISGVTASTMSVMEPVAELPVIGEVMSIHGHISTLLQSRISLITASSCNLCHEECQPDIFSSQTSSY